jgi:hypothetical protein
MQILIQTKEHNIAKHLTASDGLCLQQHTSQIYSLTNKQTFWLKPKNNQMQNTIGAKQ